MMSFALAIGLMAGSQGSARDYADYDIAGQQEIQAVTIAQSAARPIDFVPAGWKLYDKTDGDLNADGKTDAALLIQRNDPSGIVSNPHGLGYDTYDANPRILLVIMQDENGYFQLVGRDDLIVPVHDSPSIDDPYEAMQIEAGKLSLELRFFASAGSWSMFTRHFLLRWDGSAMALIGFDMFYVHRASGESNQASVNYLTGKRQDAAGNISDEETNWVWSTIEPANRPKLGEIGNGFDFEG